MFLALLVTAAGNTALQSVLPVIGRAIAIPDMAIALIFSLSALLWTFSAPYWARESDRRGRRRLMQVGVMGFGISMLLCACVILAGLQGLIAPLVTFALFTLARALFGIFGSAANPAAQAFIAGRTSEMERTTALATLSSAFGLGTILGPAVAPFFILPKVGLAGPMFAFAAIAVVVVVLIARGLPDDDPTHFAPEARASDGGAAAASKPSVGGAAASISSGGAAAAMSSGGAAAAMPSVGGSSSGANLIAAEDLGVYGRSERLSLKDSRIQPFMIFGFAAGSLQAATGQALGFFIIDRMNVSAIDAAQMIGIALMAGAGATLLVQWGVIRLLDLSPSQLMRWGTLIAAIGTLGIAFAPDFHALVIAFSLSCAGYGFVRPGFTAGSSLAVTRPEQGALAGAVTSINGSCFVLAPAIGIGLYELQPELPYWLATAGLVWLAVYAWSNPILKASAVRDV